MTLLALSQLWNDVYSAGGFYLSVTGFLIGAMGLGATYWQVRETKRAAVAAREASTKTLTEVRTNFRRFIAGSAHRYLADARAAVEHERWDVAAVRANDLADLLGQLPGDEEAGAGLSNTLRAFGQVFAAKARVPRRRHSTRKWEMVLRELQPLLDRAQAPFSRRTVTGNDY